MGAKKLKRVKKGINTPKDLREAFNEALKSAGNTIDGLASFVKRGYQSVADVFEPGPGKRTLKEELARRRALAKSRKG